jgi:Fic family protein
MRIPAMPPPFAALLNTGPNERVIRAMITSDGLPRANEYLHWDKLRHLSPPTGLSINEWWFVLKMNRQAQRSRLPLVDQKNQPFTFSLTPAIFEALHHIDQRCAGAIAMPEQVTNEATRERYYVSSIMEEAITSSLLEGAVTTREKARELLRSGRKPHDRGERMVVNNFVTMQHLRTIRDKPLTPEMVLEIHRMISHDALDKADGAGRFRRPDEQIEVSDEFGTVFHTPPPAEQLPDRVKLMCDFANDLELKGFLHPVIRAIALHFWLAYDHPFVDGNGRTARALFYWSMLRGGFWLFEFISISQALLRSPTDYYRAFLYTETDDNDLNYFILHQLECIETSIKNLHDYLDRKTGERKSLHRRLRGLEWLNHRQEPLLIHALDHPHASYTFESHKNSHGIAAMTARSDLEGLEKREFLTSRLRGKVRVFTPVPDLADKLSKRSSNA